MTARVSRSPSFIRCFVFKGSNNRIVGNTDISSSVPKLPRYEGLRQSAVSYRDRRTLPQDRSCRTNADPARCRNAAIKTDVCHGFCKEKPFVFASESRERKNGTFGNSALSTAVAHNMAYRTSDYEGHMELYLMDLSSRTAQPWALRAAISRPPEGTVPTPAASWLSSM